MNTLKENGIDCMGDVISVTKEESCRLITLVCQNGEVTVGFADTDDGEVVAYLDYEKSSNSGKTGIQMKSVDIYTSGVDIKLTNGKTVFCHAEGDLARAKYRYSVKFK